MSKIHYFILTASMVLLVLGHLFVKNMNIIFLNWGEQATITAYFDLAAGDVEKHFAFEQIKNMPEVKSAIFISSEEAVKELNIENPVAKVELQSDFPESVRISLNEGFYKNVDDVARGIQKIVGVHEVGYGKQWIEQFNKVVQAARISYVTVAIVLIFSVFFMINGIIRESIFHKKKEIKIMEMVGATPWFIRKPFLYKGVLVGLCCGGASALLSFFIFKVMAKLIREEFGVNKLILSFSFLTDRELGVFLLTAVMLSCFSSYVALRRINSGRKLQYD